MAAQDFTVEDLGVPLNRTFTGWLARVIARLRQEEVLATRVRLRQWIALELANPYLDMISTLVDLVADPPKAEHGIRDDDDSYLVALARIHGCECIVTGDKDLLEWEVQVPPCITPADFLKKL